MRILNCDINLTKALPSFKSATTKVCIINLGPGGIDKSETDVHMSPGSKVKMSPLPTSLGFPVSMCAYGYVYSQQWHWLISDSLAVISVVPSNESPSVPLHQSSIYQQQMLSNQMAHYESKGRHCKIKNKIIHQTSLYGKTDNMYIQFEMQQYIRILTQYKRSRIETREAQWLSATIHK